jgi:hypothetical protein
VTRRTGNGACADRNKHKTATKRGHLRFADSYDAAVSTSTREWQ